MCNFSPEQDLSFKNFTSYRFTLYAGITTLTKFVSMDTLTSSETSLLVSAFIRRWPLQ